MNEVAPNVFIETGYAGVNVGAIRTPKGIIAIDAPSFPRDARDWAMRLHRLSQFPIQFLVLTDYHGDRTLNSRWLNAPIITHQETAVRLASYDKRYPLAFSESLSLRYPNRGREFSGAPVERAAISFEEKIAIFKGGREICLLALPGPGMGNVLVYAPETAVLFTGDILAVDSHPLPGDGQIQAWLHTLDYLAEWPDEQITFVPGRGAASSREAIQPVREYLAHLLNRANAHRLANGPREEMSRYIPEFMERFPLGDLPVDWVKRQIRHSLERAYDEIKLTAVAPETSER
jgi:glyoxylase-like metal-dependent hydrolase (beta-lactamase superfamily II)